MTSTRIRTIEPLGRRQEVRRDQRPHGTRDQPGDRSGHRRSGAGQCRGRARGDRRRGRGVPGLARHLAGQAHPGAVRLPRAAQRPQGRAGRDHHRRARQGPLRRARRGQPRPGGRRVRLRHPAPAQGRHHRERVDQRRRRLHPPAARRRSASSPRSTSRPWCRCGSSPSPSPPATPWCSSRPRRTRRPRCGWPSCGPRPACPTASSTSLQGDKVAVDELLTNPDVEVDLVRRLHPDRAVRLRDRHRCTASACRPWAARRTTRSSCPTPTWTWPPTRWSTPASARAGERCMAISAVVAVGPIADDLVAKIAERTIAVEDRRRHPRLRHGSAGHQGAPRQGGLLHRRRRSRRRQDRRRRPYRAAPTARAERLLARPDPDRPRHPRNERLHRRDLRPGALGRPRRHLRRGARA